MAKGLAEGMTQLEAYKAAGFLGGQKQSAGAVALRPEVKARVEEILGFKHEKEARSNELAIERAAITKEYIVTRTKYFIDRAARGTKPVYGKDGTITGWLPAAGDAGPAMDGLRLLAQMGGHLVDRVEVGAPGDFARLSDEDLDKELILIGTNIGLDAKALQKAIGYHPEETE